AVTEYETFVVPVWFHLTVALKGPPGAVLNTPMTPLPPVAFGDVQPVSTAFLVLWCAFGAGPLKLPQVTTTRRAATAGLPSPPAQRPGSRKRAVPVRERSRYMLSHKSRRPLRTRTLLRARHSKQYVQTKDPAISQNRVIDGAQEPRERLGTVGCGIARPGAGV